ncbi:MAG: radical SAM family heme chaperone HemW [Leptonema sp. (in: bacteria)]
MFLTRDSSQLGIYIHFPFCVQKCYYCDFYSLEIKKNSTDFIQNLFTKRILEELNVRYPYFKNFSVINTIYFGGGTASFLDSMHIKKILQGIQDYFQISKNCEITLEGNPEHLYKEEYLQSLKEVGINRISVGFQTYQFDFLKQMNRFFDPSHYEKVLYEISKNFENWNVDLIYGFPNQNFNDFIKDLNYCLSFKPKHISCYSLTLERNTMYFKKIKEKILKKPNQKLQEKIFYILPNILKKLNFQLYEVSNYALKNYFCRHNLRYWLYEPYLGLGPSAHSFNGIYRSHNPRNWEKWSKEFSFSYQKHNPLQELPITLFRLKIPIYYKWIQEVLGDQSDLIFEFFLKWEERGFGKNNLKKEPFFLWNYKGLSLLDTILLEFYQTLDNAKFLKSKIDKTAT